MRSRISANQEFTLIKIAYVKRVILSTLFLAGIASLIGCNHGRDVIPMTEQEVATKWADMTLFVTRYTPGNSPTYASRALGYCGVTMYESIVFGYENSKSLGDQLNDLPELPAPEKDKEYNWILSLNAGQSEILKKLYGHTTDQNKLKIDSLEEFILDVFSKELDEEVINRSVSYGKQVAERIFEWSVTDGGHRGYLSNFDKKMVFAHRDGGWKPPLLGQSFSRYPLHPHWGNNRTFVKENSLLPLPHFILYSTSPDSEYFKQFLAVYEKNKALTQQEKETSLWWGDDPSDTFTPPGHSYNIGTIIINKYHPPLIKCVETYARIGIAVADAFINCWKLKYIFYSERPSTFISEHIDETWEPFWPDPPFPAFPSGHATQAASASTVLSDMYHDAIDIFDDSHAGHERNPLRELDYKPRSFASFSQLADEIANSRFYGGIHTLQDNQVGLDQGKQIGTNVNHLSWTNDNKRKEITSK